MLLKLAPFCSCTSDDFLCSNQKKCVPGMQVCDGRAQCPDGSDEKLCQSPNPTATCKMRLIKENVWLDRLLAQTVCPLTHNVLSVKPPWVASAPDKLLSDAALVSNDVKMAMSALCTAMCVMGRRIAVTAQMKRDVWLVISKCIIFILFVSFLVFICWIILKTDCSELVIDGTL